MRKTPLPKNFSLSVRWMERRDLSTVLRIDAATDRPMGECEIRSLLEMEPRPGTIITEVGPARTIGGFAIYAAHSDHLFVCALAVRPELRRRGIGTHLLYSLKMNLNDRVKLLSTIVRESNLDGCGFLKASGFRAVEVRHGWFEDEDGYLFHFRGAKH